MYIYIQELASIYLINPMAVNCCPEQGFIMCSLPANTTDVDLRVRTLQGMDIYNQDHRSKVSKCSFLDKQNKPFIDL